MGELLDARNVNVHFPIKQGYRRKVVGHIKAVDGISLKINEGEAVGLVGESGCGKTTLGRAIIRAVEPTAGEVLLKIDDHMTNLLSLSSAEMRMVRKDIQMIFQDPYASLSPRMTVENIIGEPLYSLGLMKGPQLRERVLELMEEVGLNKRFINRYAHAFSGGQRQRIGIARAIATNPRLVICDEPVSALDVSVQAQVLNLMSDLREKHSLAYLFISHDMNVVRHISDRVIVMYMGKIVEDAPSDELFTNPQHPYTQLLLSAIPRPMQPLSAVTNIGELPNPAKLPAGCAFSTRCKYATEKCRHQPPEHREISPNHYVACHLFD